MQRDIGAGSLPPDDADIELAKNELQSESTTKGLYGTISCMLLGLFLCNMDASLVLATYGNIASAFDDLENGSWILSSFILAQCVAQPLYGKLADVYGRKTCLQAAHVLFALGTAGTGLGRNLVQVVIWRAVQGCGTAGMNSMVAIIIADLVPLHEIATLRSYVNILQTTGRSVGGVIGGALTYAFGWRWAFIIQLPPTLAAMLLVQKRLDLPQRESSGLTQWQRLRRIDFLGSIFLCSLIFSACFILDTGGQRYPWTSQPILITSIAGLLSLLGFLITANIVSEPIFPLRLLGQYTIITNYLIAFLQALLQFSLMSVVPLYFQATAKANSAQAGAYLVPAFIGNTFGGLVSGHLIKRTGLYKPITAISPLFALLCMVLCYTTWHGHTTFLGALATLPGGVASGLVASSLFVGLAAELPEEDMALSASGLYLFFSLGAIAGASAGAAMFQTSLRVGLERVLAGVDNGREIMHKALSDIAYVQNAGEKVRELLVPAYVYALHQVNRKSLF